MSAHAEPVGLPRSPAILLTLGHCRTHLGAARALYANLGAVPGVVNPASEDRPIQRVSNAPSKAHLTAGVDGGAVSVSSIRTKAWRQPRSQAAGFTLAAISDDETLARRAATVLEREGMIVTVDGAGADVAALEDLAGWPDLVLVRRGKNRPGIEHALQWAQHRLPAAARIVVLPAPETVDVAGLLAAGAQGIVHERSFERTLGPVVRAVTADCICVPAEMRHAIEAPTLSHRERQILALAVAGLTNAQIAERSCLAESTVKTHLSSAFRQLGVHSRREAASLVLSSDGPLRRTVLATLSLVETDVPSEES